MSSNQNNNSNQEQDNDDGQQTIVRTSGNKPRTLHVAHRRSPSELTTLMLEQLNLQRQLEIVQAQQQQIIQQQQQLNQQAGLSQPQGAFNFQSVLMPPPSSKKPLQHHRRSSSSAYQSDNENYTSRSHRRSQSSVSSVGGVQFPKNDTRQQALGHSRRHSLGLAEAKKAAAEAQAQRSGHSPSKLSISSHAEIESSDEAKPPNLLNPPIFTFPSSPKLESNEQPVESSRGYGHSRSRSNMSSYSERSPQRGFQFPPRESPSSSATSSSTSTSQTLAPPQPAFAERRKSNSYGHKNSGSDINSNWRKQPMTPPQSGTSSNYESPGFIPGHRSRGSYGGSISSISQFNSQGGQRKSLFAPYLPQSSLPELINEGRLVTGILRVNKKNRSDAYVSTDGLLDADIFICGSKDRNRALEGDLVAIELLVVDEVWSSKREKEEKKRRKDTKFTSDLNEDVHNDASTSSITGNNDSFKSNKNSSTNNSSLNRKGSLKQRPTQKKNDDVEVEGQSLLLVEEEEINDDARPLYSGHVVAVVDRIPGQLFSGTLGLLRPSQAAKKDDGKDHHERSRPKIVWFKPTDKKVPLIAIPTEQAPRDFIENHDKYANQTFIASIKRWPITSLHPFGTLVSRLGDMEDQDVEVESILRDNNFMCDEYADGSEKFLNDFPKVEEILSKDGRKDFSDEYVIACSQNGLFSDHAFHVKGVADNKIELGVHIADVTEFVKQDTNLDKRCKKRSHGVFLPQKSVNLLPDTINDKISFQEDRLCPALSIVFEIDSSSFDIDNVWMGETIVRPSQRVNYSTIDSILNGSASETETDSATSGYISTLSLIASRLKKKRLGNPELDTQLELPLLDQLDDERVKLSLNIYENILSIAVIDEIFHSVNAAVAQKIHAALGDRALLRKYPMPALTKFEYHQKKVAQLGVDLDTTNAGTFQNSLLDIEDPIKRAAAETILVKCMGRGKYVIAGKTDQDGLSHYLFNLPTYTHFTAPLRRYADLIVHRQLKHVINHTIDKYQDDIDSLKVNSDYCNFKKDCAKAAQEQAVHLLLCQSINDMSETTGQVLCMGVILQVYESSFDVFFPDLGIEKRVHGDQLPLSKAEFDKKNGILNLYWEKNVDSATYIPEDENEPLSYRSSIKNKYRATAIQAAKLQDETYVKSTSLLSKAMSEKLDRLHLKAPNVKVLTPGKNESALDPYLKHCVTRIEGDDYIQEIKVLQQIPVLLRSEIGMALPCLTIRTLNPFFNVQDK